MLKLLAVLTVFFELSELLTILSSALFVYGAKFSIDQLFVKL